MSARVVIIGSGNIGTDLLYKLHRHPSLKPVAMVGIDPESEGLARARSLGLWTTSSGLADYLANGPQADLAVDATSASAHRQHAALLAQRRLRCIDLTPAALGPPVVPDVNLRDHIAAPEVNLITCGAQATVPVVAALSEVTRVQYAEIVSTVASRSAGPGTRQNIDEFTIATAQSLEALGGAETGKAIIILNPAEPPLIMRNTIYAQTTGIEPAQASQAVTEAVNRVASYVPGYRLSRGPIVSDDGLVTAFLQVEGAGDYLPPYAGNLDIMTAAAVRVAEIQAAEVVTG
jgi:acetaldehyde dehydrogenase